MEASIDVTSHITGDSLDKETLDELMKALEGIVARTIWKICGGSTRVSVVADYDLYELDEKFVNKKDSQK